MNIFNVSYNNKELLEEVYAISGRPYGFIERLKRGGTGTQRGVLEEGPMEVTLKFTHIQSARFCSIREMRQDILLYFICRQETFAIPMNR